MTQASLTQRKSLAQRYISYLAGSSYCVRRSPLRSCLRHSNILENIVISPTFQMRKQRPRELRLLVQHPQLVSGRTGIYIQVQFVSNH